MSYGPVALATQQSIDAIAPGMPAFVSIKQLDNKSWTLDVQLPTNDADGTELTGLTKLSLATLPMTDGINPFESLGMNDILGLPGVSTTEIPLTPSDAGAVKNATLPILNLGGFQAFAAAATD